MSTQHVQLTRRVAALAIAGGTASTAFTAATVTSHFVVANAASKDSALINNGSANGQLSDLLFVAAG